MDGTEGEGNDTGNDTGSDTGGGIAGGQVQGNNSDFGTGPSVANDFGQPGTTTGPNINSATATGLNPGSAIGAAIGAVGGFAAGGPGTAIAGGKAGYELGNMAQSGSMADALGINGGAAVSGNGGTSSGGTNGGGVGTNGGGGTGAGETGSGGNATGGSAAGGAAGAGADQNNSPLGAPGSAPVNNVTLQNLANTNSASASTDTQLGANQYAYGQNQFNATWPYAQQYLQQGINNEAQQSAYGNEQANYATNTLQPVESQLAKTALNYDSPGNIAAQQGAAEADVANNMNAQRTQALSNLESYGIDPSQTRYGALDLSTRVAQAAATAAAGTQSGLQTQATALGLQGQVANLANAAPGNVATTYNSGANQATAALGGANSTTMTGANTMGTPTQYGALGTAANSAAANALGTQLGATLGNNQLLYQENQNTSAGIGQAIGGALGGISSLAAGSGGISNLISNLAGSGSSAASDFNSLASSGDALGNVFSQIV